MVTTESTPKARPKQVAEHFSISAMTLWRWAQNPDFPKPLKRGGVVLYDIAAIENWLEGAKK